MSTTTPLSQHDLIALEDQYGAHNYKPLNIVVASAQGSWVTDVDGNKYLDCLSAYSAVNQGHCHPKILATMLEQAQKVTLSSRAFRNDQLPLFYETLCQLTGYQSAIPMNSGAEAVETAVKLARKWGYEHKGIAANQAEIIVCENNFHGRTTTVVSFSTEADYRKNFGPFTPGFKVIPFGDLAALEAAITPNTCAFLFEPIQGEAGINIPPQGFIQGAIALCKQHNVLSMADEIQCGLGRAGALFAFEADCTNRSQCLATKQCPPAGMQCCRPDVVILGKALSGGFYPVSAVLTSTEMMSVFTPGIHGSTFGGNPLGCAVARTALQVLTDEGMIENAATLGPWFLKQLKTIQNPKIKEVRGRGLMIGIEMTEKVRPYCEQLKTLGVLCKETHDVVIRLTPPLIISKADLEWALERLHQVLA
ncbi:MAG: ornithine--oxo-acid transaminase [Vampirovibrionales bacterium]|nr:ornithine--oxo-acid transaminase [Vampirovibrionales bacterium]